MLRITEGKADKRKSILRLEGQLIGPWVGELSRICEQSLVKASDLVLDVADLSYADRSGVSLLKDLRQRGAALANESAFLKEQLNGG